MRKIKNILLLIVLLSPVALFSQNKNLRGWGDIQFQANRFEQSADSLLVDFDLILENAKVKTYRTLEVTPIIRSDRDSLLLPKISVKGRRQFKEFKREMALSTNSQIDDFLSQYYIIQKYDRKQDYINYKYSVPMQSWMRNAELDIIVDLCGCGKESENAIRENLATLDKGEKFSMDNPYISYVQPKKEVVKQRVKEGVAYLDFIVNQIIIRPEYRNNIEELRKINRMMDGVRSGKGVDIKRIDIIGYASPEGTYVWNQWLSTGRAKALQNYIMNRYFLPADIFNLSFGGENWVGLEEMLHNSNMRYKDESLWIIQNVPIFSGREKRLMDLAGGVPYKYMLKNMFPALRKSICRVYYNVENYEFDEVEQVIETHPENLSLYEMYGYAERNRNNGTKVKQYDIYEKAAETFPQEDIANLNAAQNHIAKGEIRKAEQYLNKVKTLTDSPEYLNALGVIALYRGDIVKGEQLLKRAAEQGLDAAQKNLEKVDQFKNRIPKNLRNVRID